MIISLFALAVFLYDLYTAWIIKNVFTVFFPVENAVCIKCERSISYRGYDLYNTIIRYEFDGKEYCGVINKENKVFPLGKPGIGIAKLKLGIVKIYVNRDDYNVICSYKDIQAALLKSIALTLLAICGYFVYVS